MSLNKPNVGGLLDHITNVGLPYHGLAKAGLLTLADGSTMPYPLPGGREVYVVRRPGWTMPPRSEDQLAADAAAHHEWRDYALISGVISQQSTNMQIGGQRIDGWIWFDPTGAAWRVSVSNWGGSNFGALTPHLRFDRFGVFGGSATDPVIVTAGAFTTEQSTPVQFRRDAGGPLVDVLQSDLQRRLLDISHDGSRTLWEIYVRHYLGPSDGVPSIDRVLGIYELTIAPDKSISGAVVASRVQCVGRLDGWSSTLAFSRLYGYEYRDGPWPGTCTAGTGAYSGTRSVEITTFGGVPGEPPPDSFRWTALFAAPGSTRKAVVDVVVGAFYGADQTPRLYSIDTEYVETCASSHSIDITPVASVVYSCSGPPWVLDYPPNPFQIEVDVSSTTVSTGRTILRVDGTEVARDEESWTSVYTATGTDSFFGPAPGSTRLFGSTSRDRTHTRNGVVVATLSEPGQITRGAFDISLYASPSQVSHPFVLASAPPETMSLLPVRSGSRHVYVTRWSATAYSFATYTSTSGVWTASAPVARGQVVDSALSYTFTVTTAIYAESMLLSGSYQPVTGQWHAVVPGMGTVFAWA